MGELGWLGGGEGGGGVLDLHWIYIASLLDMCWILVGVRGIA